MSHTYLLYVCRHTLSLSSHPFQTTVAFFFNTHLFGRKRMQKYNLFQNYQNIFSKKNLHQTELAVNQYRLRRKNFARYQPAATQKEANGSKITKKRHQSGKNGKNIGKTHLTRYKTTTIHALTDGGTQYLSTIRLAPAARFEPALTGTLLYLFYGCSSVVLQWMTEEIPKKYRRNTEEMGVLAPAWQRTRDASHRLF